MPPSVVAQGNLYEFLGRTAPATGRIRKLVAHAASMAPSKNEKCQGYGVILELPTYVAPLTALDEAQERNRGARTGRARQPN